MPEPRSRSPAQIEASRRNGSRSRGPITPDGKTRASRNALTHGLCAMQHLVVEGEIPAHLDELIARMIEETGAVGEIETRLARRLAIAFWKGERAERIEVALLDAAPTTRLNGYQHEAADPLTTFDLKRFNAIRGQQGQIGREISRCLKELRQLRRDASDEGTDEPEEASQNEPDATLRNEPESPPQPANDDGIAPDSKLQNEPDVALVDEAGVEATRAALLVWAEARERRLRLEKEAVDAYAAPLEPPEHASRR